MKNRFIALSVLVVLGCASPSSGGDKYRDDSFTITDTGHSPSVGCSVDGSSTDSSSCLVCWSFGQTIKCKKIRL